eukprot:13191640-Alexandrium_andersonii.AAC.1
MASLPPRGKSCLRVASTAALPLQRAFAGNWPTLLQEIWTPLPPSQLDAHPPERASDAQQARLPRPAMGRDLQAFALARSLSAVDRLAYAAPRGIAARTIEMEGGCSHPDTRARGPMGLIRSVASMSSRLARRAACSHSLECVGWAWRV